MDTNQPESNSANGPSKMPEKQLQQSGVAILPRQPTTSAPVVTELQPMPTIPAKP
jgi:hypothetical protein